MIAPNFDDLNNSEVIKQHFENLINSNVVQHDKLLNLLSEQVEPIDYKLQAFPQIEEL